MTSVMTGADVNFEYRSYHYATLDSPEWAIFTNYRYHQPGLGKVGVGEHQVQCSLSHNHL
jgi:hypothetical protein